MTDILQVLSTYEVALAWKVALEMAGTCLECSVRSAQHLA